MGDVAPLRRQVRVPADPETAFRLFTAHVGAWWPVDPHSVHGAGSLVAFEGDRLVERSADGVAVWAEVLDWDPPRGLRLAWHPGHQPDQATEVRVRFDLAGGSTVVTLEHDGWERHPRGAAAADDYASGWPLVLDRYAQRVGSLDDDATGRTAEPEADAASAADPPTPGADADERWYALLHSPGPLLADGGSLFAHPLFGEHLAFLGRLRDRGLLVAAGPVAPERGEGMAVVRVPVADDLDVGDLATREDLAVAGGLLVVEVRPWDVRVSS